jgi:hypothetical protein
MLLFRRAIAALGGLTFAAVSTLPANAIGFRTNPVAASVPAMPGRFKVADVPRSALGMRDLGRRAQRAQVRATITLRYNHQAELDALVRAQSDRRSPLYHRFLTREQFDDYFAPTPQQQATVAAALASTGLNVARAYRNRTLLDVRGTTAAAERFFGTEIHSISQGRYGLRFANARPLTVSADLAPLVRAAELSNLILAHTGPRIRARNRAESGLGAVSVALAPESFRMPAYEAPAARPDAANVVKDPGFESGAFGHGWSRCDSSHAAPLPTITSAKAHAGKHSGLAGSTSTTSGEQSGSAGVCQLVKIPSGGVLSAYLYQRSNEANTKTAAQDVLLLDADGGTVATLAKSVTNHAAWVEHSWKVGAYAGRELYLYFGVNGNGSKSKYTQQYVDDVSLAGSGNPLSCNGAADKGPFTAGGGYMATGVADAFDYPVQHGCNGAGEKVAVEISSPVEQSDIDDYMSAAGVHQIGSISNEPVDGGGTYDPSTDDTLEATLDVETIVGLAPGANVVVYNFPDLTYQSIEDSYNQTVDDDTVSAANSSFGGCESAATSFATTSNSIAEQGAALGITFVASSGDNGSDECYTGNDPPGVSTPSGNPYFTALGGLNFTENSSGTLTSLTAVGDVFGTGFLSGGGVSTFFALPSYQSGVANAIASGRNSPDVSLPGVDVAIYVAGAIYDADGTSWSSPAFVALLAETAQVKAVKGLGFVNPTLYDLFAAHGYVDYHDVTLGNNGAYSALSGYDQVTGIGAPDGFAFASAF